MGWDGWSGCIPTPPSIHPIPPLPLPSPFPFPPTFLSSVLRYLEVGIERRICINYLYIYPTRYQKSIQSRSCRQVGKSWMSYALLLTTSRYAYTLLNGINLQATAGTTTLVRYSSPHTLFHFRQGSVCNQIPFPRQTLESNATAIFPSSPPSIHQSLRSEIPVSPCPA